MIEHLHNEYKTSFVAGIEAKHSTTWTRKQGWLIMLIPPSQSSRGCDSSLGHSPCFKLLHFYIKTVGQELSLWLVMATGSSSLCCLASTRQKGNIPQIRATRMYIAWCGVKKGMTWVCYVSCVTYCCTMSLSLTVPEEKYVAEKPGTDHALNSKDMSVGISEANSSEIPVFLSLCLSL